MSKNFKRFLKIILIFLMLLVLFSGILLIINFFRTSSDEGNPTSNEEYLFLLGGVDSTGEKEGTRTDTLMLVKIDEGDNSIDLISIPRDSLVYINGSMDKINAAHSYGGIDLTMETIREFLGIDLSKYLVISFDGVIKAIDAIGGIDIDVSEDVAYAMDIEPGIHHFNGEEALDYVRFRKGYNNADLGRIDTQQDFMGQLIKEATKIKNLPKLPLAYLAARSHIETNIPFTKLVSLGMSLKKVNKEDINKVKLYGEVVDIDGTSYYDIYDESIEEIRRDYLYNFSY